jgi:arylsulfatase A-like enzyme
MIKRTRAGRPLALLGLALLTSCSPTPKEGSAPPNIILITIDALRADHLSCYGYPFPTSPHMDSLAKKSIVFDHAFCTLPKTSASLASLMTGLHPFVHKTAPNADTLKAEFITLAEALKMRGYFNTAVVDNSNLSKKFGFGQGFDEYIGVWNKREKKEDSTPYITQTILDFLDSNKKTPFFLWAHYIETHTPYLPPEEFVEARPPGRKLKDIEKKVLVNIEDWIPAPEPDEGTLVSLYDATIKYIDSEIQKINDAFLRRGYQKDTIFILSSDHGEELGEHNLFLDHGPLTFSSSVRVPLIMFVPGEESRRIKQPTSLMDIYPTLLEKAGLVPPYEIQGVNMLSRSKDRFLLIPGLVDDFSVVHERYHLVRMDARMAEILGLEKDYLFDFIKDPGEKNNIASRQKDRQALMEEKYRAFFDRHGYLRSPEEAAEKPSLSKEEVERLKALGYIR